MSKLTLRACLAHLFVLTSFMTLTACNLRSEQQLQNKLPPISQSILDSPDTLELVSLQPPDPSRIASDPAFDFYGCRVLGRATVNSPQLQKQIRAKIADMLVEWDGRISACGFEPRHAVVATRADQSLQMLICFRCGDVKIESPSAEAKFLHISEHNGGVFDEILIKAGVPLAPK